MLNLGMQGQTHWPRPAYVELSRINTAALLACLDVRFRIVLEANSAGGPSTTWFSLIAATLYVRLDRDRFLAETSKLLQHMVHRVFPQDLFDDSTTDVWGIRTNTTLLYQFRLAPRSVYLPKLDQFVAQRVDIASRKTDGGILVETSVEPLNLRTAKSVRTWQRQNIIERPGAIIIDVTGLHMPRGSEDIEAHMLVSLNGTGGWLVSRSR